MNTQNESGFRTFQVGTGGVTVFTRVKLSSGKIVTAGNDEAGIGTVQETASENEYATVKLWRSPGTHTMIASAAVANGAGVMAEASGKVDDAATGLRIGTALEAATAAGDRIEVLIEDTFTTVS